MATSTSSAPGRGTDTGRTCRRPSSRGPRAPSGASGTPARRRPTGPRVDARSLRIDPRPVSAPSPDPTHPDPRPCPPPTVRLLHTAPDPEPTPWDAQNHDPTPGSRRVGGEPTESSGATPPSGRRGEPSWFGRPLRPPARCTVPTPTRSQSPVPVSVRPERTPTPSPTVSHVGGGSTETPTQTPDPGRPVVTG